MSQTLKEFEVIEKSIFFGDKNTIHLQRAEFGVGTKHDKCHLCGKTKIGKICHEYIFVS